MADAKNFPVMASTVRRMVPWVRHRMQRFQEEEKPEMVSDLKKVEQTVSRNPQTMQEMPVKRRLPEKRGFLPMMSITRRTRM